MSKTVAKVVDLGAVGYYQQQVTANSGAPPAQRPQPRGGRRPGSQRGFPEADVFVSLRYNYEFMAESRAQGNDITLTLTKRF